MFAQDLLSRFSLLAAGLLAAPLLAQPCPPPAAPQADLGNLEMAFSESSPGTWTGAGVGGAVRVTAAGVEILANAVDGAPNAVDLSLAFQSPAASIGPAAAAVGEAREASAAGTVSRPAYAELAVDGAFPGAGLVVSGSQRRLDLHLTTTAADVGDLSFTVPGAGALAVNPAGGLDVDLEPVAGEGASGRRLTLDLVALDASGEELERLAAAFALDGEGQVGVDLLEAPRGAAVELVFTVLYSPYVEPAEVAAAPNGNLFALASVRADAASERRRALVQELDAEGGRVLGRTVVDPGGDLDARGLAVDAAGRVLVAGSRDDGEAAGLYLAAYDPARGQLDESVAASGLDGAADDVEVMDDSRVALVGPAGDGFAAVGRASADFTLVAPAGEKKAERLFVALLEPDLDRFAFAVDVAAPLATEALHAWVGCDRELVVGPAWKPPAAMSVDHTYAISTPSSFLSACPQIDDGWGYGAMCWKWSKVPSWTYHIGNVAPAAVPVLLVQPPTTGFPGDYVRLNELEDNQHGNLFYNPSNSAWENPNGSWNHPQNWAYSSTEIGVALAIYQSRWDSPVFVNFRLADPTPASRAVMLRAATFSAPSAAGFPHNACNEDTDGDGHSDFSGDPWPNPPEYQVAAACVSAHGSEFELETLDYDAWLGGVYVPDQTVTQATSTTWWPWFSPYVGDPPVVGAADPMTPTHVREMSRRLRRNARVATILRQERRVAGTVESVEIFPARLCAGELRREAAF